VELRKKGFRPSGGHFTMRASVKTQVCCRLHGRGFHPGNDNQPMNAQGVGPEKNYYATLQAGRGFAALGVLLFHVWLMARDHLQHEFLGPVLGGLIMHGARGVDFFFVLSGFIIMYANADSVGQPSKAPRYFYRRLVRIYPIFLVIVLVKLGYVLAGGGGVPEHKQNLSYFLCSILLIPQPDWPFLAVSWTLCYEMLFYSIFLVFILFGRSFRWVLGLHAALCLGLNLPMLAPLDYPASFFFNTQILDFYLGCLAAHLCRHNRLSGAGAWSLVVAGGAGVLLACYFNPWLEPNLKQFGPFVWGLSFFGLIAGFATLEKQHRFGVPRVLSYLGDASYSTYLVHNNVILIGGGWIARNLGSGNDLLWAALLGLALAALLAGVVCYQWIERPLLRWFQRRGPR
jgi:exopolysaccharide production protein ExoZ